MQTIKKNNHNFILAGLTGGIASGKSTVAKMFKDLGVPVIDSDKIARQIVKTGSPVLKEITAIFGPSVLNASGSLNRKALGQVIFNDTAAKAKLNAIMHPQILAAMQSASSTLAKTNPRIIMWDVPLLFETGWHTYMDKTIVVWVPQETQLARLMARDKAGKADALARIASQMLLDDKRILADIVIDNHGNLAKTKTQVAQIYTRLTNEPK